MHLLTTGPADVRTTLRFGDICTNKTSRFVGDKPEYVIVGPAISRDAEGRLVSAGEPGAVTLVPCIQLPCDRQAWQNQAEKYQASVHHIDVTFLKCIVPAVYDEVASQNVSSTIALRGQYRPPQQRVYTRADIPAQMTLTIEGIDPDGFAYARLGAESYLKIDPDDCAGSQCLRQGATVRIDRVDGRDVASEISAPKLEREAAVELER